jgi:hypothetical protein
MNPIRIDASARYLGIAASVTAGAEAEERHRVQVGDRELLPRLELARVPARDLQDVVPTLKA